MRAWFLFCAFLSLPFFSASAAAVSQVDLGADLYVRKGCLGCHGASARGGVGPVLANTAVPADTLLRQMRHPRGIMPSFPPEVVSDEEGRAIHAYLRSLAPPPPKLRTDVPHGILAAASCAPCHAKLSPTITRQFAASAMGMAGMQNPRVVFTAQEFGSGQATTPGGKDVRTVMAARQLACSDCHGLDHDKIMASRGRVAETVCGACHPTIYRDHVTDAGHSYGPGPGKLGINWERNIGVPHYKQMPRKVMEMGCDACHAQAGATDSRYWSESTQRYVDTSSLPYRNGCIACHTRHAFSLVEARKPEACYTCHMGPDHPNYEAYMSSKHGSIYVARGAAWNWTLPLAQADYETPTCAYCHMLYVDSTGVRASRHSMTPKIIWGMGVQAAAGQLVDLASQPPNQLKRNEMIKVCMTCHSEDKARNYLESADAHKLAGDALVLEARGILAGLYHDGLIPLSHGQTAAGLLPGPHFSAIELPGGMAQHSPTSLYYNVTPIEREYFDMFFFSALKSYKGAFHMSPDYGWWYGYADVLGHLAAIRDDAGRLRQERTVRRETIFMLITGPLMVLIVLWLWWMFMRRRRATP